MDIKRVRELSLHESKVRELLSKEENSRLEFKLKYDLKTYHQKNELAKDILSIANFAYLNGGKGFIIIGYDKEKKIITSIDSKVCSELKIQQIINSHSDPPPNISVNYVCLEEGTLGIIEISKNYYGPHQLKNKGFPIRRGSSTAFWSTNEIQYAMKKRESYAKNLDNEYDILSGSKKIKTIIDDASEVIKELGFSNEIFCDYKGGYGEINYYQPCKFIMCKNQINDKEYSFNITANERGYKKDLFRINYSCEGFLSEMDMDQPIFINLFSSNVVQSFFTDLLRSSRSLTRNKIKSNIVYFGLGAGFKRSRISNFALYLPKFYVTNIQSKNDMQTKIEIILSWISKNQELFEDVFNFYNTSRFKNR